MAYTTSGEEESRIDQVGGDLAETGESKMTRRDTGQDAQGEESADDEGGFLDDVFDAGIKREDDSSR